MSAEIGSVQAASETSATTEPSFLETRQGRTLAYRRLTGERPGVVFIHGLASSMTGEKCAALEQFCRSQRRAFVCFDLSGHGQSSGSMEQASVTSWLEDLSAVMETLTEGPQVNLHVPVPVCAVAVV